jgi:carbamoyltransferase
VVTHVLQSDERGLVDDGYYVSTYLTEPGLPYALGASTRHDNCVALWRKSEFQVELVRYWELERLSGMKQHGLGTAGPDQCKALLAFLLAQENVDISDVKEIWGTPGIELSIDEQQRVAKLESQYGLPYHGVAHFLSACLMDTTIADEATIVGLAVDYEPDSVLATRRYVNWYVGGTVRARRVSMQPIASPAPLYGEARDRYRMREGTLMALASATTTDADLATDRAEILSRASFMGIRGKAEALSVLLHLEGAVRTAFESRGFRRDSRFTESENFVSAVMKEVDRIGRSIMEANIDQITSGSRYKLSECYLALAGGYALNCPTNTHLMDKYGFRGLLAPPCVNDSGQALGRAMFNFHSLLGERFRFRFPGPYLGRNAGSVSEATNRNRAFVNTVSPMAPDTVVDDLLQGPVAWIQGHAEVGPRALGARSLLADPRTLASRDALNEVKGREWWRPVAPIVLAEAVGEWFEQMRPSPYMLEAFRARAEHGDKIPAVLHLDGTARVQTLSAEANPLLYEVIELFAQRTGVPLVCNTSLNDKGEPIIDSFDQALRFCRQRGIRVAYCDGHRVEVRCEPQEVSVASAASVATVPARDVRFFVRDPKEEQRIRAEENPHNLPDVMLALYLATPEFRRKIDLKTDSGAARLRASIETIWRTSDARERSERWARDFCRPLNSSTSLSARSIR